MKRPLLLLALVVALLLVALPWGAEAASKKKRKAWTQAELDALEKEWETGDAEEDLMTPDRQRRMEMEARKNGGGAPPMGGAGGMPGMMGGAQSGPAMMFVDLVPEAAPDGKAWTSKDIDVLTRRWRQLLLTGGVDAQLYNLDDKMLASLDRSLIADCNDFLFQQPEVDFVTLDSRPIYPPGRERREKK